MRIETVKIKNGRKFTIINKCDFCEGTHELYDDSPKPKSAPKKEAPAKVEAKKEVKVEEAPAKKAPAKKSAPKRRTR